ncbi:UNVERIFIED_CONTAM: hypothetical protein FKN15_038399 [Acipenser sinensis]
MQDVASPHTSVPGGVSSANALDSHPKLPHHNLSSPSRAPEGWRPQTPFRHNRQYWHACTSDTWVLATVQNGYVLQFRLGPPPFRGIAGHPPIVPETVGSDGCSHIGASDILQGQSLESTQSQHPVKIVSLCRFVFIFLLR